ncbi:unnamed protein product [Cercopithifilaria johnstoni]|uniref:Uncharacterized protein n=1 Tax=Cercopithifilaria johnstoni TaxID=2874296 RepID=A0A8J2M7A2_9BILA|nr:unnamed protein product [Cercopithifilaria johnstoni]
MMANLPSVFDASEKNHINMSEQFYFKNQTGLKEIHYFVRKFEFNDSVIIRMKHYNYTITKGYEEMCMMEFAFLDSIGSQAIQLEVLPVLGRFSLICNEDIYRSVRYPRIDPEYYYEFVIIFSNIDILVFHNEVHIINMKNCSNRITDINRFKHSSYDVLKFEAVVEIQTTTSRIPGNWHIVKPISLNQKIILDYFPGTKNIITIVVGDRNGIPAITVTIDYIKGILYTKRDIVDDENIQCINFRNSQQFKQPMLGRIEIGVFTYRFKVDMKVEKSGLKSHMEGCMIYGHHLCPYDIEQTIIDAKSDAVFFAHYIETA